MHAIAGLYRPAAPTFFEVSERLHELFAKDLPYIALGGMIEVERKHRGVAEASWIEAASRAIQFVEHSFGVGRKRLSTPPGVEIDVAESHLCFRPEHCGMRIKIRLQFPIARFGFIAFGGEFQLLRDPPPDYRIVAIQTQSEAFAVKHLLPNITADETLQLGIRGRPLPCAREQQSHALHLAWCDDDMARLAYPPPG